MLGLLKKVSKYFCFLFLSYFFVVLFFPVVLNKNIDKIINVINEKSNIKLEVVNPKVRFDVFPYLNLKVGSLKYEDKVSFNGLKIDNLIIQIRLFPLLTGRVHVNGVYAENLDAVLKVGREGQLNNYSFNEIILSKFKIDLLKISKYKSVIINSSENQKTEIKGEDFLYSSSKRNTVIKTSGVVNTGKNVGSYAIDLNFPTNTSYKSPKIDIKVESLDLGLLSKMFLFDNKISKINGMVNLNVSDCKIFADVIDLRIGFNDSDLIVNSPDKLVIRSDYKLISQGVIFNNLEILNKDINLRIDGHVFKYKQKNPDIDFNLKIIDTNSQSLIDLLVPMDTEKCNLAKLKEYGLTGKVNGEINLNGKLLSPNVKGSVLVKNAVITNIKLPELKWADINLEFKNNKTYTNVKIPTLGGAIVDVEGESIINGPRQGEFTIRTSSYVDLLTVQKVVIPLYEIFKFKIGALPYIIPSGEISFDICAKEIRKKFFVDGDAKLKNSRVELKDLKGLCLYTKEGELNFKDDDIEVNLKDVFLNNKPANIKGKTDLDSNFEFSVISQTQESSKVYEILKNTLVFDKKEEVLNKIKSVFGCIDFNLVVKGKLNSEDGLILNKTVFLDGNSEIKNNKIVTDYGVIDNYFAKLVFAENSQEIESKGRYGNSEFTLTGGIKNNKVSLDFNSDKLELKNFLFNGYNNLFENIILKVKAKYTGDIDNFDISKIVLDASIEPFYDSIKNLKVNSGKIVLNKGVFKLDKLNAYYKNNPIDMFLIISNLEKDYKINGRVQAKGLDLKGIEDTGILKSVPNLGECKFLGGNADINSDIKNNKLTGSLNIKDVKMTHVPSGMPINIISGNLILNNDKLFITAMNGLLGDMPILLNGKITEIFRKPYMDIYVNTKPKQDFLDNYVNKKRVYPLKLKGDILCTAKVVGYQDNYNVNAKMKLEENSSLYYLGATLGDREHAINLLLDVDVNKNNKFKINKFDYEKLILSQDNRLNKLPLMSASGQVKLVKEDFIFSNFVVKTHNPTDARVFNVIFKKPNIKQGQFNSDLKINGSMSSPRIVGEFSLSGIDIPFLNTTLKDISCEFKENVIKVKSTGEALLNKYVLSLVMQNKLHAPYRIKNAELYLDKLDINEIINQIKLMEIETQTGFSYPKKDIPIIIDKLHVIADKIIVRNIEAEQFDTICSLSDKKILNVDKFEFNTAEGKIDGSYSYDIGAKNSLLELSVYKVNANMITQALFDLEGQLYGNLTGSTKLSCTGEDYKNCLNTLAGKGEFIVQEGKMPKLGSLEYLLKSGNLIKSGVTGLSINGIIDLITPLKTGEFKNINGLFEIKDGFAHTLKVYTNGKDLNLFLTGTYDFKTLIADMSVFGRLSRRINTIWGMIGNFSLNTLFNTIPGIKISNDKEIERGVNEIPVFSSGDNTSRRFFVDIYGDINGKDYVRSFQWIN